MMFHRKLTFQRLCAHDCARASALGDCRAALGQPSERAPLIVHRRHAMSARVRATQGDVVSADRPTEDVSTSGVAGATGVGTAEAQLSKVDAATNDVPAQGSSNGHSRANLSKTPDMTNTRPAERSTIRSSPAHADPLLEWVSEVAELATAVRGAERPGEHASWCVKMGKLYKDKVSRRMVRQEKLKADDVRNYRTVVAKALVQLFQATETVAKFDTRQVGERTLGQVVAGFMESAVPRFAKQQDVRDAARSLAECIQVRKLVLHLL